MQQLIELVALWALQRLSPPRAQSSYTALPPVDPPWKAARASAGAVPPRALVHFLIVLMFTLGSHRFRVLLWWKDPRGRAEMARDRRGRKQHTTGLEGAEAPHGSNRTAGWASSALAFVLGHVERASYQSQVDFQEAQKVPRICPARQDFSAQRKVGLVFSPDQPLN